MKSNFWQFIKFGIVGVSNTLINQIVYAVIVYFGGNYVFAYAMGFIISVLNAYYWGNKYVFKEDKNAEKRVWWKVLLKTYVAYFWGFIISTLLLIFWVDIVELSRFMHPLETIVKSWGFDNVDAKMLGELVAAPLNWVITIPMNFVINKYWAYSQKKTESRKSEKPYDMYEDRLPNMELLRIVSMMLVVVLHFLWKGDCLPPLSESAFAPYNYIAWGIEAFAIVAVNSYMLLSGYFLTESRFKVKRLLGLILQLWFYSIVIGVVAAAFGYMPKDGFSVYYLLQLCLPVSANHYWFMTAYIYMYLFSPILSHGIKRLTKRQLQTVIILMVCVLSVIKSVTPIRLETDMGGYDCVWYMCIFMIAAYIRLYGVPFFKSAARSAFIYSACAVCIFGFTFLLRFVYLQTGKLENMLDICYEYNHILVLAASVAFFYMFSHIKVSNKKVSRIVCRIAPYTLGVYLWHEHIAIRYEWTGWLYNITGKPDSAASLLVCTLFAAAAVFVTGIFIDMLKSLLFGRIHRLMMHVGVYRRLNMWVDDLEI